MNDDQRIRYYGRDDYGTYFQVGRALTLWDAYDPSTSNYSLDDVIELHHLRRYAEEGFLRDRADEGEEVAWHARLVALKRTVGTFFQQISDHNASEVIREVHFQYRTDVLELLAGAKAYERCSAAVLLGALGGAKLTVSDFLANKALVAAYAEAVRDQLLASPRNAEHLVTHYLMADRRDDLYLPTTLTPSQARGLLVSYVDDPDANPNFLQLIATAREKTEIGLDSKLKLRAKRAHDTFVAKFFEDHEGVKAGCEVVLDAEQEEPVVETLDGLVGKYTYGRSYLQSTLDYPSVLNNFMHVFNFTHQNVQLTMPSYGALHGVMERFFGVTGTDHYRTGAAFDHQEVATLLQTTMYNQFLRSEGIELEDVIAWFFAEYLRDEFEATGLRFKPSSPTASYLEKCRHLFPEMEGVLRQFSLFVENGELDRDLLAMSSSTISYGALPSLVSGKYVYEVAGQPDIKRVLHVLFSDQSTLTYIDEELRAESFAHLVLEKQPSYDDFHEHQRPAIDALVADGVLEVDEGRVRFRDAPQFNALYELHMLEAISYHHHSERGRRAIDAMVERGWMYSTSTLLTTAERGYFNYMLNQSEFSNGLDLRNRYAHGSQVEGEDDQVHLRTYVSALRLLVALVIKINDDFHLQAAQDQVDDADQ